jgi:primary-amine oxidase
VYNDIFYPSAEELREAWKRPDFVRRAKAVDGPFGSTARQGQELSHDTLPAPAMVQSTKRYAVDKDNKYVKWMDFEFYLAYDRDTGLKFYEIKYKGERIIFELGKYVQSQYRESSHADLPQVFKKLPRITPETIPCSHTLRIWTPGTV